MKKDEEIRKWWDYAKRIYSKKFFDILSTRAIHKDYELETEEELDRFFYGFDFRSHDNIEYANIHYFYFAAHTMGINGTYLEYQVLYWFWKNDKYDSESYKLADLLKASFYAEIFILRWYSYFEKLSHIMNASINYKFNTRDNFFKGICEHINKDRSKYNELLQYLSEIPKRQIYKDLSGLRHDLTHRYLTYHNLAGSTLYGPEIKKICADKVQPEIREVLKPKGKVIEISHKKAEYMPEQINTYIEQATDLLVEIKSRVFQFADAQGYRKK